MANSLTLDIAKKKLLEAFPVGSNPIEYFNKYPEDFYLEILDAIHESLPFEHTRDNASLALFLYAGCCRFERWFAPSPYVVPIQLHANFARFVEALKKVEGKVVTNTAVFELHIIRNAIYDEFDQFPIAEIEKNRLILYRDRIAAIKTPADPVKQKEFLEHRADLVSIIQGLQTQSLRTYIKTKIPYIVHRNPLSLIFTWKNLRTHVSIQPEFMQPRNTFVNFTTPVTSVGASRWQMGASRVELEVDSLIDTGKFTQSLQAIERHNMPVPGWPKAFTLAFSLIYELVWNLRMNHNGEQNWIPSPSDLGDLESGIVTEGKKLAWKLQGSPTMIYEAFTASAQRTEIQLGILDNPRWSAKCRSVASMYVSLGETNEALFWLNVAVEALCNERFKEIAILTKCPQLETDLNSPKAFWEPAEDIVRSQFPDMAGSIKWPDTVQHVSLYAKLKYLYRRTQMRADISQMLKNYSLVAKYRNALFHGATEQRIPLEDVRTALAAYDWIAGNMWPASSV